MERGSSRATLAAHGSRYQLKIAIALLVIIPLLSLWFIVSDLDRASVVAVATRYGIMTLAVVLGTFGYMLLRRYPDNLMRLRGYLEQMAVGRLPDRISLADVEDDISAIETYLNVILADYKEKMSLLEKHLDVSREMQETISLQAREIIEAERHRVMIESVGAACHHIGQPTTVLRCYLALLRKKAESDEIREQLDACLESVEAISEVLNKLRKVSDYRTVPYQTYHDGTVPAENERILDID